MEVSQECCMSCGGQKFRTVLEEPEFLGTERLLLTNILLLGISVAVVLSLHSQGELPVPDSEGKMLGFGQRSQRGEDGNAVLSHAAVPGCF